MAPPQRCSHAEGACPASFRDAGAASLLRLEQQRRRWQADRQQLEGELASALSEARGFADRITHRGGERHSITGPSQAPAPAHDCDARRRRAAGFLGEVL